MKHLLVPALAATLTLGGTAMAQPSAPLTAQASNPQALGWMQGFPPPAGRTIRFTDPDYFAFPKLRWTVCHFRELMPSAGVAQGTAGAQALPVALDPSLDTVSFTPPGTDHKMSWNEAFEANYTDGVIVLHHGRVVYERYGGCLTPSTLHGAMSVTKSLTGLLGEMLVAEGKLDETALVGTLIAELKNSAFGDATVRQVMDMTTALDYSENYADPNAEVWTYAKADSPLPPPPGYTGPRSYFEYLQTVQKKWRAWCGVWLQDRQRRHPGLAGGPHQRQIGGRAAVRAHLEPPGHGARSLLYGRLDRYAVCGRRLQRHAARPGTAGPDGAQRRPLGQ